MRSPIAGTATKRRSARPSHTVTRPVASDDPDEQPLWAGPASAFVEQVEPAGEIVRRLVAEAEAVLRNRVRTVLE